MFFEVYHDSLKMFYIFFYYLKKVILWLQMTTAHNAWIIATSCIFPLVPICSHLIALWTRVCGRVCLVCDISEETALSALLNILCGCLGLVIWLFIKSYTSVPPERTGEGEEEKNGCFADCFEDRLPVSNCHRHNQNLIAAEVIFYIPHL